MYISSPFVVMFLFITTIFYRLECEAKDSINARSPLVDNGHDTLVSAGNKFELGFFTPQGSDKSSNRYVGIWYYNKFIPRTVVWVANRDDPLVEPCGVFGVADDGNLKIWCRTSGFVVGITSLDESTRTSNTTVQLLDSGNLVFVDGQTGTRLWQSFDHPTDTFLPGMNMNNNKNMELTCWNSPTDPGSGNYTFRQDQEGAYSIQKRSSVYWKSGEPGPFPVSNELPYAVAQILSGSPGTELDQKISQRPTNRSSITFPNSTRPSYYNNSRLLLNSSGEIQYYYSLVEGGSWLLSWSEPQTRCSEYGVCGNFGICNVKSDPICQCLPGFQAASLADWRDGQYADGCVRMELLICRQNQTDRFVSLSFVSQIGGQVQPFDRAQEEAECKEECLNNCKCEAYLWYAARNITDRETGKSVAKCGIWSDLVYLHQDYSDSRLNLSLRIPSSAIANSTTRICQPCVAKSIPYPLSVGPNCGDPLYDSFRCNNSTGEISFLALSGKYQVTSIYQEKRRFVILVGDSKGADCNATKLSSQSLKLNQSLPFTVTNWCYTTVVPSNSSHIEIGWEPPLEPTCDSSVDCKDWPDSDCRDKSNNGQSRCYCNQNYQWDDSSAICAPAWVNSPSQLSRIAYLIVFPILVLGVVLAICSYILYRRKRTGNRGSSEGRPVLFSHESKGQVNDLMHENNQGSIDVPFYNLDTVLSATNKFSDANMLGRGGFGPVYKGMFPGGREIAVKRLSSFSGQGMEEFRNEVMLIAKLQHRNLVRLLGYCTTENEKILLYEYMPNRSLDAFLFDQNNCLLLDWDKRFNIILGIARGLLYLHQDSRLRIIHRDLKTSNVLLDEDMNPKISDFGLARIVQGKGTEASTNKVVGTYGYMSPEYALDGKFSTKSDVFSFGVVMLEIISGKKNTGFYNPQQVLNLIGYAWGLWIENKALDLADPTVLESCEESQVIIKCINVGLLCVQEDPNDRPSMSTVVVMLGSENTSPLPLPNQPAFVVRKRLSTTSSSTSTKPDTISNNELTVSMADGR